MDAGKPSARLLEEDARLRNDVAAAELISGLNRSGIASILLKGPSISRWLYDEGESRIYGDVDLLVSPQEFEEAEAVAAGLGFRHIKLGDHLDAASRHRSWFRERDGVCIELHRGFAGVEGTDQELWDEVAKDSEPLALGVLDVTALVPGITARALLVGLHAATHGPVGTAFSDLQRALERLPEDTWEAAAKLARRLQAEPAFALGLGLAPEGARLIRRLGLNPMVPAEVLINTAAPPTTAGWEWFAAAQGFGGKFRFLASKLAPSRDFMRVVDPIGRRGGAWVAVAYVVRPIRLAIQAPRGFRTWRDARRRAS